MTTYQFAGFWRRFIAYTIDSVAIFMIFCILAIIAGAAFLTGTMSANNTSWIAGLTDPKGHESLGMVVLAFYVLLFIGYFTFFQGLNGRTPGKKLLGLQVVTDDGRPISFGIAFLRSVGYLVSSLLFTLPLGYIWAAFDKKKQGWHDKIAGTVVIIREPEETAAGISIPDSTGAPQNPAPFINPSGGFSQAEGSKTEIPSVEDATGTDSQKIP